MNTFIDIQGYPGYMINKAGMIWSNKSGIYMKTGYDKDGYVRVGLRNPGKNSYPFMLHRLIALHFIPNPNNYSEINHMDGDKANNDISNLEWCTHKHNMNHAINCGLWNASAKGEDNSYSKLLTFEVNEIRDLKGMILQKDLASIYGVSNSTISSILNNKTWV